MWQDVRFVALDGRRDEISMQRQKSEQERRTQQMLRSQKPSEASSTLLREARTRSSQTPRQRLKKVPAWVSPFKTECAPALGGGGGGLDERTNSRIASAVYRELTCGNAFSVYARS